MVDPATALAEWVMWALGGLAALLTVPLAVIKRNRDRSVNNKRQLEGDPNDPNAEGVLEIAHQTREHVEFLDEKMDDFRRETHREHQAVMDRLESLNGQD